MPSLAQNPSTLKQKSRYAIASVFVIWHTMAIAFVGPWPFDSRFKDFLAPYFSTYIDSLQLGADWKFYAPDVALGSLLSYEVQAADGRRYSFDLTRALNRSDPAYYRYTTTYIYTIDYPEFRTDFLEYLCRKHADLAPTTVDLDIFWQRRLEPEAYVNGDRPMDPSYLRRSDIATISCRASPVS